MKKNFKKVIAGAMTGILLLQPANIALADSEKVVTLGADLTKEQKAAMLEYFGVNENEVTIVEVNNQEERSYLEGIATEAEIGTHTYSCAYIMPTNSGEINVKTAHLTWVSTSMIANTLVTAGIDSCDVIAAAPRDVSGTGALTGVIKAYEKVTDEELDPEKTDLAMKELYETAELGSDVGQDEASALMNEVKNQVIKDGMTDEEEISEVVEEVADYYKLDLTEEQVTQVSSLMSDIGRQDYDYDALKGTMDDLQDKLVNNIDGIQESFLDKTEGGSGFFAAIGNFFAAIGDFFAGLFGGGASDDAEVEDENSILNGTDESALGIEPTDETSSDTTEDTDSSSLNTDTTEDTTTQEDTFTVDENNEVTQEDTSDATTSEDTTTSEDGVSDLDVSF